MHYAFSFNGNEAHCREGYDDAAAVLGPSGKRRPPCFRRRCKSLTSLGSRVHGPASELDKLREPLSNLSPAYFELLDGFRR